MKIPFSHRVMEWKFNNRRIYELGLVILIVSGVLSCVLPILHRYSFAGIAGGSRIVRHIDSVQYVPEAEE